MSDPREPTSAASENTNGALFAAAELASFTQVIQAESAETSIIEVGSADTLKRTTTSNREGNSAAGPDGLWDGYSGTGYFDPGGQIGDGIRFTVTAPEAGTYRLTVRYANGDTAGAARPMALAVDGQSAGVMQFAAIGAGTLAWQAWAEEVIEVTLQAGANVLTLVNTTKAGPNLDRMVVTNTATNSPPAIVDLPAAITVTEGALMVVDVDATDPDAGQTLTYSIAGGADAALFTIDAVTGILRFKTAPDFEIPTDANGDNVYDVTVGVSDGVATTTRALPVTVADGPDGAFNVLIEAEGTRTSIIEVGSADTVKRTFTENRETNPAAGPDGLWDGFSGRGYLDPGSQIGDGFSFTINAPAAGEYRLIVRYTNGDTAGANRPMLVKVDGAGAGEIAFTSTGTTNAGWEAWTETTISLTLKAGDNQISLVNKGTAAPNIDWVAVQSVAVNLPPVFQQLPAQVSVAENGTNVLDVNATDPNPDQTLTYSISGADAGKFTINPITGALVFNQAPDFENPTDAGANNVYDLIVSVSDGAATTSQALAVTVTDVAENPPPTSEPGPRQTVRINFQDGATPKAPGYLVDNFQGYGDRGNGYQYGWVTEASATDADGTTAIPIDSSQFPAVAINERTGSPFDGYDARLTGYAHFDLANYPMRTAWQMGVANGWYEVTVAVGDTGGPNDSIYKLQVEGVLVSDYRPTDQFKTQLVTQVVQVTDGFLTLAAPTGTITEIQYVEARALPDLTPGDGREAPLDYAQFIKPVAVAQEGSEIYSVDLDPASGFPSGVDPEADIFLGISVAENRGGILLASLRDGSFRLVETLTGEPVAITANTTGGADSVTITPNVSLKPFTSYTLVVDGAQDRGSTSDLSAPPREFQKFTTTFVTGAERVPEAREVAFEDTLLINGATQFDPDFQPTNGGFLYTSLELAPDGRHLYVATLDGQILRFAINPATGGVNYANREVFAPGGDFNVDGARRGIVGLAFDPEDANVIWITDNQPIPLEGRDAGVPDFSGRISKVTLGPNGALSSATIETYVTGLPRSNGDHVSNSLEFRANPEYDAVTNPDAPKHLLYLTQGSNSAMGEADSAWGFRPERLLSASVLEIDPTRDAPPGGFDISTEPLPADGLNRRFADADGNLKNGGIAITSGEYTGKYLHFAADGVASVREGALASSTLVKEFYDPFADDAVVKLFAAGTRNAYDLVWHSNGNLYVPTNGSAAGGNVPNDPSTTVNERRNGVGLQPDYLFKVEEGGYYGHPNPLLDNFIMNGGNPTSSVDPNEVTAYALGTLPDPNYRLADTYSLGNNRSPNGAAEYTSSIFGASLKGGLIFTEYSGGNDLRAVLFDENGRVSEDFVLKRPDGTVIQEYVDPLDVVINPLTGQIYMLTLDRSTGRSQVVLLDPKPGAEVGDTTADEGGDLALAAIDMSDPAAAIFAVAGLDSDITALRVSFDGGATSQVVTLDAQDRFTIDLSGLGTGTKTATLIVTDNADNTAQAAVSFTLAPPPADTSADEDGNLALTAIDLSNRAAALFEASGLDADIQSITVQIGSNAPQPVTLGADGRFTLDLGATSGQFAVTLQVTDDAANTASVAAQLDLPADTSADEDGNLALAAIDLSNRAAAVFEVTGLDPDIDAITVQVGNNPAQPVTLGPAGRFTIDLGTASGEIPVTLQVTDGANNIASVTTQLNLPADTSADEDGNLALAAIDLSNRAAAIFEITGLDADIQSITVQIGTNAPQPVTVGTNGRFTLDLGAASGEFSVTVQVTDEVANTATAATQLNLPPADISADEDGNLALAAVDLSNRSAAVFEATGIDADIVSIAVQIGANAPQTVTLGPDGRFTLDLGTASGDFPVTLQVTDEAANTATAATQVTLAPESDAQIRVQSLDPTFFDNRLHYNWIQNPETFDANGQRIADRDYKESGTVRFTNDGTTPLEVLSHQISGPFKLANPTALNNVVLAPGQSIDVKVDFNRSAYSAASSDGAINNFSGQLRLTTNDPDTPVATVDLAGFYQSRNEGGREPNVNEIWEIFGFGNSIEGLSRIKGGEHSTLDFYDLYIAQDSTEILNPYFRIADGVTTARITHIAAFHSPSGAPLAIHNPANVGQGAVSLNHSNTQSQSILPLSGSNFTTATFTNATIPDGWAGNDIFGVRVAGQSTNPLFNPTGPQSVTQSALTQRYPDYTFQAGVNGAEPKVFDPFGKEVPTGYTVRVFEAVDQAGLVIPNTYLIAMDYTGINYDFNDNLLVLEGVTPVSMADIALHEVGGTGDRLVMGQDPSPGAPDEAVVRISNDAVTGVPTPQNIGMLRIESVTVADPALFEIVSPADLTDLTLAPGASIDVTVRYIGNTPATPAMVQSALIVRSNDHDEGVLSFDLVALPERGAFVTGVNYGGGAIASDPVLGVPLKAPTEANGVTMTTTRAPGTDSSQNANGANATPGSAFKTYQDAAEWTTTIAVPNGTYIIGIHTQETYWNLPHKRIFDVTVNGELVADDLDPFVAAGYKGDTPVLIEALVTVTDGKVTILLDALAPDGIDNAAINAVTIYEVASAAPALQATLLPESADQMGISDPAEEDTIVLNIDAHASPAAEPLMTFAAIDDTLAPSSQPLDIPQMDASLAELLGDALLHPQPELVL